MSAQDDPRWRQPGAQWKCAKLGCGAVFRYDQILHQPIDAKLSEPQCPRCHSGDIFPNDEKEWQVAAKVHHAGLTARKAHEFNDYD